MSEVLQTAAPQKIRIDRGADLNFPVTVTSLTSLAGYTVVGRVDVPGSATSHALTCAVSGNVITVKLGRAVTATLPPVVHYIVGWTSPSNEKRGVLKGAIYVSQVALP